MKIFDSSNRVMKFYLHFAYISAITLIVLMSENMIGIFRGETLNPLPNIYDNKFLPSFALGTLLVALTLYLHLPKMIERCFNIGRKFGL
jgi:hypothetical protein